MPFLLPVLDSLLRQEQFSWRQLLLVCASDPSMGGCLITVKPALLFTLLTQCNSVSSTAGFTFNFTAGLSHVP